MNRLKDKLYNYEVSAPAQAWEKISSALDESELANEFPRKIYDTEIVPPLQTWDKITTLLDAQEDSGNFAEKLYHAEVPPPPTAWRKIANSLETVQDAPVRPLYRRSIPIVRYAVAASIIALVAFFAFRMTVNSNNEGMSSLEAKSQPADSAGPAVTNDPGKNTATVIPSVDDNDDAALEQSKKMLAKLEQPSRRNSSKLNSYPRSVQFNYADFVDKELSQSIYAYEEHEPNTADRYMMLMTPDGKIIRMSKQWGNLLCCVSGEEQDADCKDQLKKWQEKLATSPVALTPGNFMDILGLVNSLDENAEL